MFGANDAEKHRSENKIVPWTGWGRAGGDTDLSSPSFGRLGLLLLQSPAETPPHCPIPRTNSRSPPPWFWKSTQWSYRHRSTGHQLQSPLSHWRWGQEVGSAQDSSLGDQIAKGNMPLLCSDICSSGHTTAQEAPPGAGCSVCLLSSHSLSMVCEWLNCEWLMNRCGNGPKRLHFCFKRESKTLCFSQSGKRTRWAVRCPEETPASLCTRR